MDKGDSTEMRLQMIKLLLFRIIFVIGRLNNFYILRKNDDETFHEFNVISKFQRFIIAYNAILINCL